MTCRGRPGLIQPPLLKSAGLARGKTGFFFASLASLREEFSRLSAAYVKLISHDPALFHGGIFRNRGIVREGLRSASAGTAESLPVRSSHSQGLHPLKSHGEAPKSREAKTPLANTQGSQRRSRVHSCERWRLDSAFANEFIFHCSSLVALAASSLQGVALLDLHFLGTSELRGCESPYDFCSFLTIFSLPRGLDRGEEATDGTISGTR